MLTIEQIMSLSRLTPEIVGIYFLFKGDECVYVGKSRRVHMRVAEHMRRDFRFKDFDSYSWVPCTEADASSLEAYYIALLRPRLNIVWCGISPVRRPKPDEAAPLFHGVDLDAEIAQAKASGRCSRNIKQLVRVRMGENVNNNKSLARSFN